MISVSEGKEGRIFKISPLYAHRAHVENSLVTSFEVTSFRISAHLTCSRGQKSLWTRQGCICLQSLCLQDPACPFVDGMNTSFCATRKGCKGPWLHWAERWMPHKPQVLLARGWQWALEMGGGPGRNSPWAEWSYFPWFLSPPSIQMWQRWVYGWIPEWSNNSVPLGNQMFLSRCWVKANEGDPTPLAFGPRHNLT